MRKSLGRLIGEYVWVGLAFSAILALIVTFDGFSLPNFVLVTLTIFIVLLPLVVLGEWLGERRHRTILKSKLFESLQSEFSLQYESYNNGRYHGLLGEYEGTAMRIYYDWSSRSGIKGLDKVIVVQIYYEPLWKGADMLDVERLDSLNKKYRTRWRQTKTKRFMRIEGASLIYYVAKGHFKLRKKLQRNFDHASWLMKEEGLTSITIERMHELTDLNYYMFGAEVESFQEPLEAE